MLRLNLRTKLLISIIIILLPVLALLFYDYRAEYEQSKAVILDEQMRTAQAVAVLVDTSFDNTMDLGWSLATNPKVSALDPNVTDPYLQDVIKHYPQFEVIGSFNEKGDSVGTSLPYQPGQTRINIAGLPQFQQPMATNAPYVSEVYLSLRTSRPVIAVSVPIRDSAGNPKGVFTLLLYTNYLPDRIGSVQLAPGQNLGLADHTGRIAFFTTRPDLSWDQRDISSLPAFQEALAGNPVKLDNFQPLILSGTQLGAFTPTPKYGWIIGITTPVNAALAPAQEALTRNLIIFGAVAFLSLAVGLLLSEGLVGPLHRLTAGAIALGKGNLDTRVKLRTGDELDSLANAFNGMAEELSNRIADNVRLAEDYERQAALLKSTIESMADAVFTADPEGNIISVNRAAEQMFGFSSENPTPRTLTEIDNTLQVRYTDGSPVPVNELTLANAVLKGKITSGEERLVCRGDGQDIIISLSSAPVLDKTGKIIMAVSVARDVTEIKRLERMRDEFLSVAAHELKTPVTAIKGYAQLIKQWAPEGHEPREGRAIDTINRQCDRLTRLVNELLEVSRLQLGKLEVHREAFDPVELVKELCNRASATTQKHSIIFKAKENLVVMADRDRVEQVILNLLDNAIKFSPKGGDIEVSVLQHDQDVVVSVTDHGVGIPAERREHIFERFYRAHADTPYDYGGMGMGLFISKEIVEMQGGRIWFESEEGKGTTFSFSLPLAGGPSNGTN